MFAATVASTPTVSCPDGIVTFTCTLPGSLIQWKIIPPEDQGPSFRLTLIFTSNGNVAVTEGNPAFRGVLTDSSGGMLTATLTSLSEASIVEGTSSQEGPLTITVAGEWLACTLSLYHNPPTDPPFPPLNPRVSSIQNQPSSSIITLEWEPPFPTGVSIRYVLIISPTPVSESPVTVETTSTQITVSYNIPYNVTIKAVNCAGMSDDDSFYWLVSITYLLVYYCLLQLPAPLTHHLRIE